MVLYFSHSGATFSGPFLLPDFLLLTPEFPLGFGVTDILFQTSKNTDFAGFQHHVFCLLRMPTSAPNPAPGRHLLQADSCLLLWEWEDGGKLGLLSLFCFFFGEVLMSCDPSCPCLIAQERKIMIRSFLFSVAGETLDWPHSLLILLSSGFYKESSSDYELISQISE